MTAFGCVAIFAEFVVVVRLRVVHAPGVRAVAAVIAAWAAVLVDDGGLPEQALRYAHGSAFRFIVTGSSATSTFPLVNAAHCGRTA